MTTLYICSICIFWYKNGKIKMCEHMCSIEICQSQCEMTLVQLHLLIDKRNSHF